jgi:hypothetical protein
MKDLQAHRVGRVLSLFFSRRNWDSPNPSPKARMPPSPRFWGEGNTRWRERGWESPNSDEGTDTVVLFIYTYFVSRPIFELIVRQNRFVAFCSYHWYQKTKAITLKMTNMSKGHFFIFASFHAYR